MTTPFLLAGLLGLPLLAAAQTSPAASHFYLGGAATVLTDRPFHSRGLTYVGPALTVGWQFTSRLAVQLSGSYHSKNRTYSDSYVDSSYGPVVQQVNATDRIYTFPLLLRATLTAPASAWHVDVLGGPVLQHGTSAYTTSITSLSGVSYYSESRKYSDTSVSLALGPSVRYSLLPRLDVVVSGLADLDLREGYYSFSNRLTSNLSAGLNYNFNR